MSKRINPVKCLVLGSNTYAIDQFLERTESELDFCVARVMLCAHLAALFCLVVTGLSSCEHRVVFDASALARMVASVKSMAVMAWLAD